MLQIFLPCISLTCNIQLMHKVDFAQFTRCRHANDVLHLECSLAVIDDLSISEFT